MPVQKCSAKNLSQDVASALVRWRNSIGDQERRCPEVIGNDAQGSCAAFAFFEFLLALEIDAAKFGGALHQRHEKVRVVIGDDSLEDGGDAFEAHASID